MSAELNVSRITVLGAYAQLRAEGYFETRKGAGTFISGSLPEHLTQVKRPAVGRTQKASGPRPVARRALLYPDRPTRPWIAGLGAFAVHQPAFEEFPYTDVVAAGDASLEEPQCSRHTLHRSDGNSRRFREAICDYLRTARAVQAEPEQIMIVSGSQQALQITASVLVDPGDASVDGGAGLPAGARRLYCRRVSSPVPVPVDDEGLNVTAGIKQCARRPARMCDSVAQYPLGSTMSAARRLQLLNWAQQHGAWIIEDDYDSEYRFESTPVSSLQGLDTNERVIYIGTFSKVLFASLRLGYMVIPPDLVERFVAVRHVMDIFPPYLFQDVIADFMREGHFARHIRRMRLLYSGRRRGAGGTAAQASSGTHSRSMAPRQACIRPPRSAATATTWGGHARSGPGFVAMAAVGKLCDQT